MLRGANIVTITNTNVLTFATRYDNYRIVVKMPPTTVGIVGGIAVRGVGLWSPLCWGAVHKLWAVFFIVYRLKNKAFMLTFRGGAKAFVMSWVFSVFVIGINR